ncbi:MAG TPA: serine protease [Geminicoccaceae bacterium]|nr:serine protease [Geminicoccaceae bacterium]
MRSSLLACLLLSLPLTACGTPGPDPGQRARFLSGLQHGEFGAARPLPAPDAAATISRSIWGIVPTPPALNSELRHALVRGSAVAVRPDTLLASCRAVGDAGWIGLGRLEMYRVARVRVVDAQRDVCELQASDAPLVPVPGFRSFGDLRVGERIFAVVAETSSEMAVAEGRVTGKDRRGRYRVETSPPLPHSGHGAVLVDDHGNLVGLATADGPEGPVLNVAALAAGLAPGLANRDLGEARVQLARLERESEDAGLFFLVRVSDEPVRDRNEPPVVQPTPDPPPDRSGTGAADNPSGGRGSGSGSQPAGLGGSGSSRGGDARSDPPGPGNGAGGTGQGGGSGKSSGGQSGNSGGQSGSGNPGSNAGGVGESGGGGGGGGKGGPSGNSGGESGDKGGGQAGSGGPGNSAGSGAQSGNSGGRGGERSGSGGSGNSAGGGGQGGGKGGDQSASGGPGNSGGGKGDRGEGGGGKGGGSDAGKGGGGRGDDRGGGRGDDKGGGRGGGESGGGGGKGGGGGGGKGGGGGRG